MKTEKHNNSFTKSSKNQPEKPQQEYINSKSIKILAKVITILNDRITKVEAEVNELRRK